MSNKVSTDSGKPCILKLEIFKPGKSLKQILESLEIRTRESWKFTFPRELIRLEEINV